MVAFDTNVLIYAADGGAGAKHDLARRLIGVAFRSGLVLLPTQVVAEFIRARTRKLGGELLDTLRFVEGWTGLARVEPYRLEDIMAAGRAHGDHGLPFFDALIWAVCERTGVAVLASEDYEDGRRLGRVTFLDPFAPANAQRLGLAGG
jgi:predicted nucleic acid-binding protein